MSCKLNVICAFLLCLIIECVVFIEEGEWMEEEIEFF